MSELKPSAFGRFAEWASGQMVVIGIASTTIALGATALGYGNARALFVLSALMFLLAQVFIARWMFGTGVRSIQDLGFGSNRRAMKYLFFMKGLDWRISAVAAYALGVALLLALTGLAKTATAAFLLSFLTCGAATQAMRMNRFWPADMD